VANVAPLEEGEGLLLDIDWTGSDGILAPEIAATWCQLSIWVGNRCLTLVDADDSSFRRSLYVSSYPLAEWIVYNWWQLTSDMRPSAIPLSSWAWANVYGHPWLRAHNVRAASGGMAWPDLTIVPEGGMTRLAWKSGPGLLNQPVRFIGTGDAYVRSQGVVAELARFVNRVVDRLREADLESPLSKEWEAVRGSDRQEAEFNRASARLGLDPYDLSDGTAEQIVRAGEILGPGLIDEYLDSADPRQLDVALRWWETAHARARGAATVVASPLSQIVLVSRE
jgi:hypothetical protein